MLLNASSDRRTRMLHELSDKALLRVEAGTIRGSRVYNGLMLGDAGLRLRTGKTAWLSLSMSKDRTKHGVYEVDELLPFFSVIKQEFISCGIYVSDVYPKIYEGISKGKRYLFCHLSTSSQLSLSREYYRWYPNGIKEVPKGFTLTPQSAAFWLMCDGSTKRDRGAVYVYFSTYSFGLLSVLKLQGELSKLGIPTYRSRNKDVLTGAGIRLYVYQHYVDNFMRMVDPFVIAPFRYKIAYRKGGTKP